MIDFAQKPDRLSALLSRFELQASALTDVTDPAANLLLLAGDDGLQISEVQFWPVAAPSVRNMQQRVLLAASVSLGGGVNPMARALPAQLCMAVEPGGLVHDLAQLIAREAAAARCGGYSTLQRLLEVLVIMLLRHALQQGASQPGLIAGLADARISRALVAIHEAPQQRWRSEDLAALAGLSRSQFMACFASLVGQTPFSYLRQWRLTLVRQDLAAGARVKTVAARYGYGSQEALSHAYRQHFGQSPTQSRQKYY
ncbi:helix-turn-helix transcriptional regulator [Marinobacterium sedimentorum]|uniref:helix-turn-helix transcriptional regulator n=1 Tax=Marinobacterium sedimentorum TaxID=2927804 RepID=UPI0020C6F70A|nr:AraC family transcriptional regulator [Marinobacterium sedimentorum]MCP8687286.1 AraC family transcriptional regulator [Marinobacterium sedimentorum]